MTTPTAIDHFAGAAAAWTLGLHRAGIKTVAACEADPWRRRAHYARWGVHMFGDVRQITEKAWRGYRLPRPFLIAGSPPCQHISAANSRGRGVLGDRLFFEAARVVDVLRPAWFAFENSDRLPSRGLDTVAAELERSGYELWSVVLGAAHAGAAHRRARCFVIGRRLDSHSDGQGQPPIAGDVEMGRSLGEFHPDADREPRIEQRRDDDAIRQERADDRCGAQRDGAERRVSADAAGAQRGPAGQSRPPRGLAADAGAGLRIEQGRRCWPDGSDAPIALHASGGLGPVGTPMLGGHLRAYAGVSDWLAEQCRAAYGDSIPPQLTEAIGRAILQVEGELSE